MEQQEFFKHEKPNSDSRAADAAAAREGEKIKELEAAYQEALDMSALYESIVSALAEDFFNLFYVNVETGEYIEYGSRTKRAQKNIGKRGLDFFNESRKNAKSLIYHEDQAGFIQIISKENLLNVIRKHGSYLYQYRLMIDAVPTFVSLKAAPIPGDDTHIIIGISNVDTQVKDRLAAEQAREERKTYQLLSALNGNLIVLYFIDPESGQYTQFRSSREYENLGLEKQGSDFFRQAYEDSFKTVAPEDQVLFQAQITKETILDGIARDGMFALVYRMTIGSRTVYVRLKAAMLEEGEKPMLILGVLDEDAQIRQEQEYAKKLSVARTMATVDSLTGVKNKHAYVQWEEKINSQIAKGQQEPFAVVVCDVNNLKAVNDQYGHKEGDACIKKACSRICGIFDHSPVFRVGGDEFVVLLSGEDYNRRQELMELVSFVPKELSRIRMGETISAGMAEYDARRHSSLLGVFEEADKVMYDRKQLFKKMYLTGENETFPDSDPEQTDVSAIQIRKSLLIADDIESNREILGDLLKDEYDILYASDGVEALQVLRSHKEDIDLVILDLYMPNLSGRDVIARMQVDDELMGIPVIFLTVDQEAELDCLRIGAMDFIPKPYPDIEIVKARIAKCIELSEKRDLIRHTERDRLTGLLNKEYFFRYVKRLDHLYREAGLDALVCDVNRFHSFNRQYGKQMGDQLLRRIGSGVERFAQKTGGMGCRQGADTFLLYCPHQKEYDQLLRTFLSDVTGGAEAEYCVGLRIGVFSHAQEETQIEERFVRASIAADRVKDDPDQLFAYYGLD